MKEQIETRIAKLIEAVKRASLEDSSGKAQTGDALDRLVDAIEVVTAPRERVRREHT